MVDYLFGIQPYFIFGLIAVVITVVIIFAGEIIAWFNNRDE